MVKKKASDFSYFKYKGNFLSSKEKENVERAKNVLSYSSKKRNWNFVDQSFIKFPFIPFRFPGAYNKEKLTENAL